MREKDVGKAKELYEEFTYLTQCTATSCDVKGMKVFYKVRNLSAQVIDSILYNLNAYDNYDNFKIVETSLLLNEDFDDVMEKLNVDNGGK